MTSFSPVLLKPNQHATDVTSLLATPGATTMTFTNDNNDYLLLVTNGATTATLTLDVGATVLGQSVTAFTPISIAANCQGLIVGPFDQRLNADGEVTVVFSNLTTVKAVLLELP